MLSFPTASRIDMRRLFVKGDIDGLFGLGLDNLVNLILMSSLCLGFLGFSNELFYGQILPGAAIGMIVGNAFYAWQAIRLAKREGRNDVCALTFGLNIIAVFGSVFPTTLYIGHPGWKALGARSGYSILNACVMSLSLLNIPPWAPVWGPRITRFLRN